jgi:hypothetical protein
MDVDMHVCKVMTTQNLTELLLRKHWLNNTNIIG